METFLNQHPFAVFFTVFAIASAFGILWQGFLLRVWGKQILREQFTGRVLYLKTNQGEFRFDKVHQKFSYKLKGDKDWWSKDFDEVRTLEIHHSDDTASMIEFFFGDWNLFDLAGRYRDLVHTYTISLKLGKDYFVPIFALKQYEQRDWFFGQLYIDFCIWALKLIGLYQEADDVAHNHKHLLIEKIKKVGLALNQWAIDLT